MQILRAQVLPSFKRHERLAELMRSLQGRAVLSINDHPEIRRVFEGFALVPLQIRYSVGREGRNQHAVELIIKSWGERQAQLI